VKLPKNSILCDKLTVLDNEKALCEAEDFAGYAQSCEPGFAVLKIRFTGNNPFVFFVSRSLAGFFTFGLGITGAASMSFFIWFTLAVGAGLCFASACV
jgi:hypothetical protein